MCMQVEESKVYGLVPGNGHTFTRHKHKYSLQTKDQKPADKEIFERHVKLQADPRQIRGGASIG